MNIFKDKRFHTYIFLVCRIILCVSHFAVSLHSRNKLKWLIRLTSDDYNRLDLSLGSVNINSDTSLVENLVIDLDNSKTGGKFSKPHNSFILLSLYATHYINTKAVRYIIFCSSIAFALTLLRIAIISLQLMDFKSCQIFKGKVDKISNLTTAIGLNVLAMCQGVFGIFLTNQICRFETEQPYLFTKGEGNNIFSFFGGCDIYSSVIIASILCWLCSLPDTYILIANIPKKFKFTTFCSGLKLVLGFFVLFLGILTLHISKYCSAGAKLSNQLDNTSKTLYPKYNMYEYISDTFSTSLVQNGVSKISGSAEIGNLVHRYPSSDIFNNLHMKFEANNQVKNVAHSLATLALFSGVTTILTSFAGTSLGYFRSKTLAVFNACSNYFMGLTHIFTLVSTDYSYCGASFYCGYEKYFPSSYVTSYEQNRFFDWTCTFKFVALIFIFTIVALLILSAADMITLIILLFK